MRRIIPSAIGLLALLIVAFMYKLDEPMMRKVKSDLDERRKLSQE
jgi:Na+/melibiose symporter-like transporter